MTESALRVDDRMQSTIARLKFNQSDVADNEVIRHIDPTTYNTPPSKPRTSAATAAT